MALKIAVLVVIMLFVGYVGQELNIGVEPIIKIEKLTEPTGSGIFDAVKTALAPLAWGFNAMAAFLQIMTWQAHGVPTLVNVLFTAIGFFMAFTMLKFIRGG